MPESHHVKGIDVKDISFLNIVELFIDKLLLYVPEPRVADLVDQVIDQIYELPAYHLLVEFILLVFILRLLFAKSYQPGELPKLKLGEKEIDELCADWIPEPLVPKSFNSTEDGSDGDDSDENEEEDGNDSHAKASHPVIDSKIGERVIIGGEEKLNFASANFLGFCDDPQMEESAVKAVEKHGVGSCGPRGFYGTVDVHLKLEDALTDFFETEETVTYSYGFATIASAIPAYCKKSDIIFVDDGVSFPIQKGLLASNSNVKYFNHNNMGDLERLLLEQDKKDVANPKKAKVTRKFIIVEGLYYNYGDICPLDKLVALKNKYKVYLMVEESYSMGTLGKLGRGVSDHFKIDVSEIDLIVSSTECALASIGGFCTGSHYVVNHQRLNSSGYVFSASLPPLLNATAICALEQLQSNPGMVAELQKKAKALHSKLSYVEGIQLVGADISPVKHLRLVENRTDQCTILQRVVEEALKRGVLLVRAKYIEDEETHPVPPSIRVMLSVKHTNADIEKVASVLKKSVETVLRSV
eukprot:Nk52_evm35s2402 gene=Nk52_evmTU35s2402